MTMTIQKGQVSNLGQTLREMGGVLEAPPSAQEIKTLMPLEWVIGHLWGMWGVGTKRVQCPSLDHGDSTPSFNLWAPDSSGAYTRFGCYGCGIKGDLFDAIQLKYSVGFFESLTIATEQLLPEYQKSSYIPGLDNRPEATPDEMRAAYDDLLGMGEDMGTYFRFLNTKILSHLGLYPNAEWRWKGHRIINAISLPHYDGSGALTAVKLRDKKDESRKWGVRGSRYPDLYGAWRDLGRENVVLCEGESDTVYAAWQLRDRNCDVMGIPTGAKQNPPDQAVSRLANRRVWMVFDGDAAGLDGMRRWRSRLAGGKIIEVPAGRDICNCGVSVAQLLGLKELNGTD